MTTAGANADYFAQNDPAYGIPYYNDSWWKEVPREDAEWFLNSHPQMLAEAEHVPGRKVIKPVVIQAGGEFLMCALPACYRVLTGNGC